MKIVLLEVPLFIAYFHNVDPGSSYTVSPDNQMS